jgi:hypothetical protein
VRNGTQRVAAAPGREQALEEFVVCHIARLMFAV